MGSMHLLGGEVIGLGWTGSQVNCWGVLDPECRRLCWPFSWGSRVTVWKWQSLPLVNLAGNAEVTGKTLKKKYLSLLNIINTASQV